MLPGAQGIATLKCEVVGGESGAPVLRVTPDRIELVGIVSSRAVYLDIPIALAPNVEGRITPMIDRLSR